MDERFVYQASANRVIFGTGTLNELRPEAVRLGVQRTIVICTIQQTDIAGAASRLIGSLSAGVCARAVMHTPTDVTALALADLKAASADGIISIGGGSTIGLGKALSVRTGLPHIAVPTTYAGSEMTPILGETQDGVKTTRRDATILPNTTIYDTDLTVGLPVAMTVTSGMNAIAHAVEALYAPDGNPIVRMMAEDAIRSIARAIPVLTNSSADRDARYWALYGAWLAGACLGAVSMSFHHKLCHVLGGSFDLPHAETHTVVLPYAVAYVAGNAPVAMEAIRRAIGCESTVARGLQDLAKRSGAPYRLDQIGMKHEWLDRASELAMVNPYWTPRPLDQVEIRTLLEKAFTGQPPG